MRIIATECTKEQQEKDMPELVQLHAQALKTDMMWEFFGGILTLPNGNKYQVADYQYEHREKGAAVECGGGSPLTACGIYYADALIGPGRPPFRNSFDTNDLRLENIYSILALFLKLRLAIGRYI